MGLKKAIAASLARNKDSGNAWEAAGNNADLDTANNQSIDSNHFFYVRIPVHSVLHQLCLHFAFLIVTRYQLSAISQQKATHHYERHDQNNHKLRWNFT